MNLVQRYLTKNRCYTNPTKIKVQKLVLHSLGVAQPNANVLINNWDTQTAEKSVHAFVMDNQVIQTLPWEYKAWHVGSGKNGSWNSCAIGVELCEPAGHKYNGGQMVNYDAKKNEAYFNKVYNNAVELFAYLCREFKLDPLKDIYCHCEVYKLGYGSNHSDVMQWFPKHGKDMDKFRADVKALLDYVPAKAITPDSPKKEISKIRPSDFVMFFLICCAAMYLSNFITQFISLAIRLIKGGELLNPLDAIVNSNYIIAFIYAVLIAPVFEEIIFRKLLLNKLRRFGDLPAILMTGLAFGLFHFNFLQFFYAAVLGFLFAYITIRSNTIAYSVILHMIVNFIGTSAAFFVMKLNIAFAMLLALWVFTALILGVLFFVLNIKRIRFERALQTVKASEFVLNPGFILFLLISIAAFAINTLA